MLTMLGKGGDRALGFFAVALAAAVIGGPFALVLITPLIMAL
jgi:hypothetical protein